MKVLSSFIKLSGRERVGVLIGFLLVESTIAMFPSVGSLYYVFLLGALLYLLLKGRISGGSFMMVGLYIACLCSIWVNDIPAFFQPYQRFAIFLLLTLLVSPTIYNYTFTLFRIQTFVTILKLLRYVIIVSAIYGLMGGGYKFVYFQGITNHSMLLGPFAALSVIFCVYHILITKQNKKKLVLDSAFLLSALFCLLQAASRTAFLATIVSVVLFLAIYLRNKLGKYIRIIITISLLLIFTFPVWGRYADKLVMKNQSEASELNVDSRSELWEQRLVEFNSSPFFGIGFSSVSTNASMGNIFSQDGKVETGSSWLSILSMIGLFGFFVFVAVYVFAIWRVWKMWYRSPMLCGFLMAILCFWAIHMVAEGYILAAGSPLAMCVWLTLGVVYGVANDQGLFKTLQQKLA